MLVETRFENKNIAAVTTTSARSRVLPLEIATIFLSLSPFVSDLLVSDSWVSSTCVGTKRERLPLQTLATTETIDKVILKERGVKRNETWVVRPSTKLLNVVRCHYSQIIKRRKWQHILKCRCVFTEECVSTSRLCLQLQWITIPKLFEVF
jgi:hypothetical protein